VRGELLAPSNRRRGERNQPRVRFRH
jgi:hypothetical protein